MIFSVQKREYLRLEDIQLYDADIVEMNEPKTYVTEKELGHYGFTNTMPDNFHYVRYCIWRFGKYPYSLHQMNKQHWTYGFVPSKSLPVTTDTKKLLDVGINHSCGMFIPNVELSQNPKTSVIKVIWIWNLY